MAHYQRFAILRQDSLTTGNSSESTPVKVFFTGTSNEAPIFSDFVGGASITQPLLTNTLAQENPGRFSFFIADGIYDVVINPGGAIETRFDEEVIKEKDTFILTKTKMEAAKYLKLGDVVIITDRADARGTVVTGETPNTFNIIDLTPANLQWQLNENGVVKPTWYGAPTDGTDAVTFLQFVFDNKKDSTLGDFSTDITIDLGGKEFIINSDLVIDGNLRIEGGGGSIKGTGTEKLKISKSSQSSDGPEVYINNVIFDTLECSLFNDGRIDRLEVTKCKFTNVNKIYDSSSTSNQQFNLVFSENEVFDCERGLFVQIDTLQGVQVQNNVFKNLTVSTGQNAAIRLGNDVDSATEPATRRDFIVTGNRIDTIAAASSTRCWGISCFGDQVNISNNIIKAISVSDTNGAEGIFTKTRRCVIEGNILVDASKSTNQASITIKGDQVSTRGDMITCINNVILFTNGILGTGYGIWSESNNVRINNNYINGATIAGIGTSQADVKNISIENNTIIDTRGRYGINLTNAGRNTVVSNNIISGSLNSDVGSTTSSCIISQSKTAPLNNLTIENNEFDITSTASSGAVTGVTVTLSNTHAHNNVKISGNDIIIPTAVSSASKGVTVQGASGLCNDLTIKNNIVKSVSEGIDIVVPVNGLVISGNEHEVKSTTDASQLILMRIPLGDESAYDINATVIGKQSDSSERVLYKISSLFFRDGGIATREGSVVDVVNIESASATAWSSSINASGGNDAVLVAFGDVATDVDWNFNIDVISIQ